MELIVKRADQILPLSLTLGNFVKALLDICREVVVCLLYTSTLATMSTIIDLQGVTVSRYEHELLRDVTLTLEAGDFAYLTGPDVYKRQLSPMPTMRRSLPSYVRWASYLALRTSTACRFSSRATTAAQTT